MSERPRQLRRFQAETPESPVTINVVPRHATMYRLFDTELERLVSGRNSIHLAFFTLCLGVSIGLGTTLLTVNISDPKTFATFVGLFGLSLLASAYFGFMFRRDYRECKNEITRIKQSDKVD
jgi:hypothetical protein